MLLSVVLWLAGCCCLRGVIGTNHFAVCINGTEDEAQAVARDYGFVFFGKLFSDCNIYHFQHPNITSKRKRQLNKHLQLIQDDKRVVSIERQILRYRDKRTVLPVFLREGMHLRTFTSDDPGGALASSDLDEPHYEDILFNDPFYAQQWYLHNYATKEHDLNVRPVWKMGWTGRGVTLSVLDDGLQHSNVDIGPNYEPSVSYDVANLEAQDSDPTPNMTSPDNSHGTYCAAIMAAVANNNFCGVGVAYEAKVGGVRLLEGPVTDLQESLALSHGLDKVDVYSASWGPKDDGAQVDGPRTLATAAFRRGVTKGRNGKGVIYVWAVGNGGQYGDNCNLDGYASNIYTLSVNSLTEKGLSCFYDEMCSSTLASVYVGGRHNNSGGIEGETRRLNVVVPELNGQCRDTFQGTSAAAPMAAGIIALVLQANPKLTWRDVQHLVVQTAAKTNDSGWRTNGAGFHYHLIYGFGSLNALEMVKAALRWTNVPPHRNFTDSVPALPRKVPANKSTTVLVTILDPLPVDHLEHVVVNITLRHKKRGQLEMFLVSPAGTVSQILTQRKNDFLTAGFKKWNFVSVNFWGEKLAGTWQLEIVNHSDLAGELRSATFVFFGYDSSEQ